MLGRCAVAHQTTIYSTRAPSLALSMTNSKKYDIVFNSMTITQTKQLNEIDWNFPLNSTDKLSSIHPYPAKFIPEIPGNLIDILKPSKETAIFDPFCGSGTTMVEAQKRGYDSIGIDLNPIACLISRVKTSPFPNNYELILKDIVSKVASDTSVSLVNIPNVDHWFPLDIQSVIYKINGEISLISNPVEKDFFQLVLSSIIVNVSNQESDTRYAAVNKSISAELVLPKFEQAAHKIASILKDRLITSASSLIINSDILNVDKKSITKPIGLLITSPPYPNAYEYWLYHKYRMYWLGYDPIKVKEKEIGARAHFFKKNRHTANTFATQMKLAFGLFYDILCEGGYACFVIGRSKIHGEIVDNAKILVDIASENHFMVVDKIERNILSTKKSFNLTHANIKTESIIVFRKENVTKSS